MSEVKDTLERESERYAIRDGAFDRMSRRRDRKRRNERVAAIVVGLAIAIVLVVIGSAVLRSARGHQPANRTKQPILREGEVLEIGDGGATLVGTDTSTRDQRTLARCTDCFFAFRKFSASAGNRWIAYGSIKCVNSCGVDEPGDQMWVVGAAGPPIRVVDGSWVWAWSPTQDQLAFVARTRHGAELVLLDPATSKRTSIVATQGAIPALAWSPDGSMIAYVANEPTQPSRIFLVRPGANPEGIGGPSISFACCSLDAINVFDNLVWSPDGTRLALSTERDGLTVVPIDGSSERTVSDGHPQSFAWSPDGREIAFMAGRDVVIVPASGGTHVHLGSGTFERIDRLQAERWIQGRANWFRGFGGSIVWSPDGTIVAFTQGLGWKAVSVG
jgi:dipeptidyl aminopeptidase/acylaminoacyl peptidase